MTNMTIYLGGVLIPKPLTFKKDEQMNGTDLITLNNNIWTDFTNISRSWKFTYGEMLYADYVSVRDLYFRQNLEGYLHFTFPAYNIYTQVKMDISDAGLALNGVIVRDFSFTLREATAVS